MLTEGLLSLGLLKGTLKANLASGDYRRFYMHKTGHWIGLDVHDVGEYKVAGEFRELEPGMAFTIEPGLYIAPGMQGRAGEIARNRRGRSSPRYALAGFEARADSSARPPGWSRRLGRRGS